MKYFNENKLSIAVIGGGLNSAVGYAHYSAINLSNKFKIHAGCFSRNEDINKKTSSIYGVPLENLYSDYKKMLDREKDRICAVVILTPSDQHYEQVMYAINKNIPIVCEKSLTVDLSECQKIIESQMGNFISVVFNYLSYPMVKELREIVHRGNLGEIFQIQAEMQQEGFLRLKNGTPGSPQEWRLSDGGVSKISLDLGTHLYSLIKYITGNSPEEVISISNNFGNFPGVVDDVNCILKYSNKMVCNVWYSKVALGSRNGLKIRIYGTKGSAEWVQTDPEHLRISDESGNISIIDRSSDSSIVSSESRYNRFKAGHPSGFIESLANYYEDVWGDLENYMNGGKNFITFGTEESRECIKLLESISESSKNSSWKKIG